MATVKSHYMMPNHSISIIIPALNEATSITACLSRLQPLRQAGHEVILVDGGSTDGTPEIAAPFVDQICHASKGRAAQMNHGAEKAKGDIFWFLHADTVVPPEADLAILQALQSRQTPWGRFDIRLSGRQLALRMVERMVNWRSRWTGIATGDQGIFVLRTAFQSLGGYAKIPLMEDICLSSALRQQAKPACLRLFLQTSSRRWEEGGIFRTILLMWGLRLAYFLGADPSRLASYYRTHR